MKTLEELQKEMDDIAFNLNVASSPEYKHDIIIPTKTNKRSWDIWYEMGDKQYLKHMPRDRASGVDTVVVKNDNELLFQQTRSLISSMARSWEMERRQPGVDSRRLWFARQIELFSFINHEWQQKVAEYIRKTIISAPYCDTVGVKVQTGSYNWIDTNAICPSCNQFAAVRVKMHPASSYSGDKNGPFHDRKYSSGDVMSWFAAESKSYKSEWQSGDTVGTCHEACCANCLTCGADLFMVVWLRDFKIRQLSNINLDINWSDINVEREINSIFDYAISTVSVVYSRDSARDAIPALDHVLMRADRLSGIWEKHPQITRISMSDLTGRKVSALQDVFNTIDQLPNVGIILRPLIDQLIKTLQEKMNVNI